jgi:hypothetical protein
MNRAEYAGNHARFGPKCNAHRRAIRNDSFTCASCQGGAFQWVRAPPGVQPEATGAVMQVTK